MVVELYKVPITDKVQCQTLLNNLLQDESFLSQPVDLGESIQTSGFIVKMMVKLVRGYLFANEFSLCCKPYTPMYFSPLCWPTVLLVCPVLHCSLMDGEDTGHKILSGGWFLRGSVWWSVSDFLW